MFDALQHFTTLFSASFWNILDFWSLLHAYIYAFNVSGFKSYMFKGVVSFLFVVQKKTKEEQKQFLR